MLAVVSKRNLHLLLRAGFLITWSWIKEVNSKGCCNVPGYVARRLVRIWPPLAFAVFVSALVPIAPERFGTVRACRQEWWAVLTMVNVFVPDKLNCLGITWYIPVQVRSASLPHVTYTHTDTQPTTVFHTFWAYTLSVTMRGS